MTCLIVDDNPKMREVMASIVRDFVDRIVESGDGAEAVLLYGMHRPDWVLMDVRLGAVNGIWATRQITRAYPRARVVMVSDDDGPELRAAARDAGACSYVAKENLWALRQLLGHPQQDPCGGDRSGERR